MAIPLDKLATVAQFLGRLLGLLGSIRIGSLVNLVEMLRLLRRGHHPGLYEILLYDTTLEILDKQGKRATFTKHERVRFLQDNVIAFQDYAWGEGEIFADYRCKPGMVVDRYQEGDRWNILISLRSTKHRGDIEDFYMDRTVVNGFMGQEEWCQVEIRNPTRRLRLAVILPRTRHSTRAQVTRRSRHQTAELGPEHIHDLPDGRQLLKWEAPNVRPLEIFTLKWWW